MDKKNCVNICIYVNVRNKYYIITVLGIDNFLG